jgi:hypothetical protein
MSKVPSTPINESRTVEVLNDKKFLERKELRYLMDELKKVHRKTLRVNERIERMWVEKYPLRVLKSSLITRIKSKHQTLVKSEKRRTKCPCCLKLFTPHKNNPHQKYCSDVCKSVVYSKKKRLENAPKVYQTQMKTLLKRQKHLQDVMNDFDKDYKKKVSAIKKSKTKLNRKKHTFKSVRERRNMNHMLGIKVK